MSRRRTSALRRSLTDKSTDDHDLQPRELGRGVERVDAAHVDLERALDRVLGVVGAQRELARDPLEQVAVAGDDRCDPLVRVDERSSWPSIEHPCRHAAAVLLHE